MSRPRWVKKGSTPTPAPTPEPAKGGLVGPGERAPVAVSPVVVAPSTAVRAEPEKVAGPEKADAPAKVDASAPAEAAPPKVHGALSKERNEALFGNERYSYGLTEPDSEAGKKLEKTMKDFHDKEKAAKALQVDAIFATADFAGKPKGDDKIPDERMRRSKAVMTDYPKKLRKTGTVVERLRADEAFAAAYELTRLSDAEYSISLKGAVPAPDPAPPVGKLLLGDKVFRRVAEQTETSRAGLVKASDRKTDDASYVLDDNDVPTRRFAYLETSRQQFFEALGDTKKEREQAKAAALPEPATVPEPAPVPEAVPAPDDTPEPAMRGRYQRHRMAMRKDATPLQIDQGDPELASLYETRAGAVSKNVMANIHQFLGSGINQRGLSLTSTPKEQVYSNDGDSFRSSDGVRLKVDLARVPRSVILLNHYSRGGVGSQLAGGTELPKRMLEKEKEPKGPRRRGAPAPKGPRGYNYAASVVKNRELYLSELRAEWIVEVRDNLKAEQDKLANPTLAGPAGGTSTVPQLRKGLGEDEYRLGIEAGRKGEASKEADRPDEFSQANYRRGYLAGAEERAGKAAADDDVKKFWQGYDAGGKPASPDAPTAYQIGQLTRTKVQPTDPAVRTRDPWFVLVSLRSKELHADRKPGDKSAPVPGKKFRSDMHDSFWTGWAAEAAKVVVPPPS